MFNTVILSGARQYIYNTWKVTYSYKNTYVNIRLYGSGSHKLQNSSKLPRVYIRLCINKGILYILHNFRLQLNTGVLGKDKHQKSNPLTLNSEFAEFVIMKTIIKS